MKTVFYLSIAGVIAIIGLVIWLVRPDPQAPQSPPVGGMAYSVSLTKPLLSRPLAGVFPNGAWGLPPHQISMNHASPGAEVIRADDNLLEVRAEGWHVLIEADDDGRITSNSYVVCPMEVANKMRSLRCTPADPPVGYLLIDTDVESGVLQGRFSIELTTCVDEATGKSVQGPGSPLTVRGHFRGIPRS